MTKEYREYDELSTLCLNRAAKKALAPLSAPPYYAKLGSLLNSGNRVVCMLASAIETIYGKVGIYLTEENFGRAFKNIFILQALVNKLKKFLEGDEDAY